MPDITSWHSCVETIVAIAVPGKGSSLLLSSSVTFTNTHGGSSPHRNFGARDVLAIWVVVTCFDLPTLWATVKEPWAWALLFWLQPYSWDVVGSTGSDVLEDVIFTQCKGASSPKTLASVNIIRGSIISLSSHTHSANWHGSPDIGGWAFSAQCCNDWHMPGFFVVDSCGSLECQIAWC